MPSRVRVLEEGVRVVCGHQEELAPVQLMATVKHASVISINLRCRGEHCMLQSCNVHALALQILLDD